MTPSDKDQGALGSLDALDALDSRDSLDTFVSLDPLEPAEGDGIEAIDFQPARDTGRRLNYRFRWLHAVLAAFGFAALLSAWFVLSARSVLIDVDPITAQISVDEGFALRVGQRYLMREGDYVVSVSNAGFFDETVTLSVSDEAAQTHAIRLRKLPGVVSLSASALGESLEGARVLVDGVDVGLTPLADIDIDAGAREIRISKERYLDASLAVEIEGRRQEQAFALQLAPAWATVSFTTSPPGAELLVDGESVGLTPLNAEILQGRREVLLKLAGYKAWSDRLTLEAGAGLVVPRVELEPADGLVFIQSVPSGASVMVSGEFKGQTPLEVALAPNVEHRLSFFRNGYEAKETRLTTRPDEAREVSVTLDPVLAEVTVVTTPRDAELFIDGESRGSANQTLSLMAISQRIEVRRDGYVPYEAEFTPRRGLDQEVRVELVSLEQARIAAIKPMIENAAGQRMKLLNPDRFTMGASRREAGRRPNEMLREVVLERPFYLSLNEVSNADFRLFDPEHNAGTSNGLTLNNEAQPAVRVTWTQAALFTNWLSAQEGIDPFYRVEQDAQGEARVVGVNAASHGYRLPTEAEWEWAARRDTSAPTGVRKYAWDGELPPPSGAANLADLSTRAFLGDILFDYDDRYAVTAPVGSFAVNQLGFFDLAGNVAEWVNDYYGSTGSLGVERDPLGPEAGQFRVIRGSSWAHGTITELRLSFRDFGEEARDDVGFRVARYLEAD